MMSEIAFIVVGFLGVYLFMEASRRSHRIEFAMRTIVCAIVMGCLGLMGLILFTWRAVNYIAGGLL